ncbi:MAG: DUF5615 family PIN-like protein [Phormidium sp.]
MSQIRIYIDEDSMKQALVIALGNSAVDVITVSNVNRTGYSDEEQLKWATEEGRVLYSANIADFCRIHSVLMVQGGSHAGIILVQQQRYSVGELLGGILNLMEAISAEDMMNQVVFLSGYITK